MAFKIAEQIKLQNRTAIHLVYRSICPLIFHVSHGKIFLIFYYFNTLFLLRNCHFFLCIRCAHITQFFSEICILYYFCNTCPLTATKPRVSASHRSADKFYHSRCLRLSGAYRSCRPRPRCTAFARTVALICNTCGSSELPMREDEWCVRMRLRPDCGEISQVERARARQREGRRTRDRTPPPLHPTIRHRSSLELYRRAAFN